jgi:hypothetical protein
LKAGLFVGNDGAVVHGASGACRRAPISRSGRATEPRQLPAPPPKWRNDLCCVLLISCALLVWQLGQNDDGFGRDLNILNVGTNYFECYILYSAAATEPSSIRIKPLGIGADASFIFVG